MVSARSETPSSPVAAAAGATFFLLLGVGVVWFTRRVVEVDDGVVLTALVVTPALLYVILRGGLSEFKMGGLSATFRVARATVTASGETLDVDAELQIIEKESMAGMTNRLSMIDAEQPVLMTMKFGRHYSTGDVEGYLNLLVQFPRFHLVALLKDSGEFLGSLTPSGLRGIMRNNGLSQAFLDSVAAGNLAEVSRYPGVMRRVVRLGASNADALVAMTTSNINVVAVVDDNHHLRGVVEREQIVSRLILSIAGAPET